MLLGFSWKSREVSFSFFVAVGYMWELRTSLFHLVREPMGLDDWFVRNCWCCGSHTCVFLFCL